MKKKLVKIYVVIDVQNDYIAESTTAEHAYKSILRRLNRIEEKRKADTYVVLVNTAAFPEEPEDEDTEVRMPKCAYGTEGQDIPKALDRVIRNFNSNQRLLNIITKMTHGSPMVAATVKDLCTDKDASVEIELMGLNAETSLVANAIMLGAAFPWVPIYVESHRICGKDPEHLEAAIKVMESCGVQWRDEVTEDEECLNKE